MPLDSHSQSSHIPAQHDEISRLSAKEFDTKGKELQTDHMEKTAHQWGK